MINIKAFLLLIVILLVGCSVTPAISATAPISNSPTPLDKPEESQSTVTPTIIPSAHVSTESSIETKLNVNCAEVDQTLISSSDIEDSSLLLQDKDAGQVYLLDMKSRGKHLINGGQKEILSDFSVSPDGKKLVFIRSIVDGIVTKNSVIEIQSSDGEVVETIPVDIDMFISRWLDNERIVLSQGLEPSSPQIILDTVTKSQQGLQTDIPDLYDMPPTSNWENQGIVVYDPSLTRAIYAGGPADIVLEDVSNNSNITRLSPAPVVHSVPKWSPDGQQVVFTYADILNPMNDPDQWRFEIYSLNRDGQMKQLTHLSESYNYPHMPYYKWSPDGKHIAFWLETSPLQNPGVFDFSVLNLDTGIVTNYCIKSVAGGIPKFFWSPNSDYVILETFKANGNKANQVVFLDIEQGKTAQIGENIIPLGWMAAP